MVKRFRGWSSCRPRVREGQDAERAWMSRSLGEPHAILVDGSRDDGCPWRWRDAAGVAKLGGEIRQAVAIVTTQLPRLGSYLVDQRAGFSGFDPTGESRSRHATDGRSCLRSQSRGRSAAYDRRRGACPPSLRAEALPELPRSGRDWEQPRPAILDQDATPQGA